ncbi:hypothetical protein BX616_008801, partial [Lobosporangium transversale]
LEDNVHAFHDCSDLKAFWDTVHQKLTALYPTTRFSITAKDRILCWPRTDIEEEAPLAIHIHSAAVWAIYVTFCQLGDGQTVKKGDLETIFMQNIRRRAADDWIRACQRDKKSRNNNNRQQAQGQNQQERDKHRQEFKAEWEHAPFIQVTDGGGPKFDALFHPVTPD